MRLVVTSILLFLNMFCLSQGKVARFTDEMRAEMRSKIKEAAARSWQGYKQYAWGHDDLMPLSKMPKDWYTYPMLMTPVDAFDTFVLLGLTNEAKDAKQLILDSLNVRSNNEVQIFEVTIRILGGLLSAYELDGDKRFLVLAREIGNRMLPAFGTPTGMPCRYINLQTGKLRDSLNNPAEIGSLLLEFGQLSKLTGNPVYYRAARKAILAVFARRSKAGLVGEQINVINGRWTNTISHAGGCIDSYYEYLYKGWLLFGDKALLKAFNIHNKAIKTYLIHPTDDGWFMQQVDMYSGKQKSTRYGALEAYFAGLCAYSGDVETAVKIQQANYFMWTKFGMEPEAFDFVSGKIISPAYILRPENFESCFYLYRATGHYDYLWMAKVMMDDILTNCRSEVGYTSISDVTTKKRVDQMESFYFAETLKYAYLVFSDDVIDLQKVVFNTEAHLLKIHIQ